MSSPTHERAFEDGVVAHLTAHGWHLFDAAGFDPVRGVFAEEFVAWVRASQPEAWATLFERFGDGAAPRLAEALVKHRASLKTPELLRRGFELDHVPVAVAVFPPAHERNAETLRQAACNRLGVARQVRFDPSGTASVDLVLALNGVPVATVELKSRTAGQQWSDAVEQYRQRPTGAALFRFGEGPVVHFAVDSEEAWMTTALAREATSFVPFNRGTEDFGAGNPINPRGARTAYLWEEVWARDTWLEVLGRFVQYVPEERRKGKVRPAEVVFPRYHQFRAVRRLTAAAAAEGPGGAYLVQHSAGSGKSRTIAWLVLRLANLFDAAGARVFDVVLVVTDRRVLDDQLTDELRRFHHERAMVADVDGRAELVEALAAHTARVVLVTVQTFPYVAEALSDARNRRFALVIDEAHSSQRGTSAEAMYRLLAEPPPDAPDEAPEPDGDTLARAAARALAAARKRASVSVFAFTATPRDDTKADFGQVFDLYSMRQAIEEGFIEDVLDRYVTYDRYFRIVQLTPDDPEVDRRRAAAALARRLANDPKSVAAKVDAIAHHFVTHVRAAAKGRAKAMVVAPSRLVAVRYTQALRERLKDEADVGVFVAFSGKVTDAKTGEEFTEEGLNGVPEKHLPGRFDRDDARILVVASKYQTGFDQPLLVAMYVDRALADVQAVQTLSRLNRRHPDKDGTFVLDFVNGEADIVASFRPFHAAASVVAGPTPEALAALAARLDGAGVYTEAELDAWLTACVDRAAPDHARHAGMLAAVSPAVDRARALPEAQRDAFRSDLDAYLRTYGLVAHALAVPDPDAERRYGFGRTLRDLLTDRGARGPLPDLARGTAVVDYRVVERFAGSLSLLREGAGAPDDGDGAVAGTASGRRPTDTTARLSAVLAALHARYGLPHEPAVEAMLQGVMARAAGDAATQQSAVANDAENFVRADANRKRLRRWIQAGADDGGLGERFAASPEALDALVSQVLQALYDAVRAAATEPAAPGLLDAASRVRLAQLNERRNVLEPRLRRFVRGVLEAALGPERWIEPVLALLPEPVRRQLAAVPAEVVWAERLLLSNVVAVVDAHWGRWFAPALEAGRAPGERVTRAQVVSLLEYVNAHREDAHARPIGDAEFAAVSLAIDQLLRVIGAG